MTRRLILDRLPGLPLGTARETVADQLFEIANCEPWVSGWSRPNDGSGWSLSVGRSIRGFASAKNLQDYWKTRSALLNPEAVTSSPIKEISSISDVQVEHDSALYQLHPGLRTAAKLFKDRYPAQAALGAFQAIESRVKKDVLAHRSPPEKSRYGAGLMSYAMHPQEGVYTFNLAGSVGSVSERQGVMWMFMGAFAAFRNSLAHESYQPINQDEVWELLVLASMLMRRLDEAALPRPPAGDPEDHGVEKGGAGSVG
ncbi:TIGR02391 family protein [Micromonospora sp. NPDC049274]|uniref:TIGR02391 family protein n=1 Tax=Micromonospora sp. NPDC049274 TaxID=3154829 RepID=UPI00341EDA7E